MTPKQHTRNCGNSDYSVHAPRSIETKSYLLHSAQLSPDVQILSCAQRSSMRANTAQYARIIPVRFKCTRMEHGDAVQELKRCRRWFLRNVRFVHGCASVSLCLLLFAVCCCRFCFDVSVATRWCVGCRRRRFVCRRRRVVTRLRFVGFGYK